MTIKPVSLKTAIMSQDRVILFWVRGFGWAATKYEGAQYSDLKWYSRPQTALEYLTGHLRCEPTDDENAILNDVVNGDDPTWACEWWPLGCASLANSWSGWLRPFEKKKEKRDG